jgi:hypothetical protein
VLDVVERELIEIRAQGPYGRLVLSEDSVLD